MYPKCAKAIRELGSTSSSLTSFPVGEASVDRAIRAAGVGGFEEERARDRPAGQTPDLGVLVPLGRGDGGLSKNL